ncbi:hypothetical protein [Xanthomonas oryzae]|uniref:hypothetical protein n=1 Tax=Xanthomonas oryzae TaxID=347 RepID=UPI001F5FEAE6|nr:hypothetical protein [Xanthomonas oryzae]
MNLKLGPCVGFQFVAAPHCERLEALIQRLAADSLNRQTEGVALGLVAVVANRLSTQSLCDTGSTRTAE